MEGEGLTLSPMALQYLYSLQTCFQAMKANVSGGHIATTTMVIVTNLMKDWRTETSGSGLKERNRGNIISITWEPIPLLPVPLCVGSPSRGV